MAAVTVPADAIRAALLDAGFKLLGPRRGNGSAPTPEAEASGDASAYEASLTLAGTEEQWYRCYENGAHVPDRNLVVKVYSSVRRGAGDARGVGEDAIRVVALRYKGHEKGWVGIWKSKRIFRTGTVEKVIQRMIARMREGYLVLIEERKLGRKPASPASPAIPPRTPTSKEDGT